MSSELAILKRENKHLRAALQHIADPIGYLRKEAESKGEQLNGSWAVRYAESVSTLREVARSALAKTATESEWEGNQ